MRKVLKINKVRLKAFVDLGLLIVFPISAVSGIVLRQLPGGGYQGGREISISNSFLGIDLHTWNNIHYNFHLLFILLIIIHLILSWDFIKNLPQLIRNYVRELKGSKAA